MPKVADLPGRFRICQFHNDHDPPHFHVQQGGADILITIADLRVLRGDLPRSDLSIVRNWAGNHRAELALNWVLARAGLDLQDIPYP